MAWFLCNNYNHLRRLHIWGCQAYILDPTLQDCKKIPKYNPWACQGNFWGYLSEHATNVGLVLNLNTKCISSQLHILYDDFFMMVKSVEDIQDHVLMDINWDHLIHTLGTDCHFDPEEAHLVPPMHPEWEYPPAHISGSEGVLHCPQTAAAYSSSEESPNQRAELLPSPPQPHNQRDASLPSPPPSMPEIPVPTVNNDKTALGSKEYEIKYKEAPPVLPESVPSPPLSPVVLCCSSCPCKLNMKYFNEDNVTMASAKMAAAYKQLDPDTKLKMIQFPNFLCCFNIAASEEKLNHY
eukprot:12626630-Ditylum_brightwellii.AAC.1